MTQETSHSCNIPTGARRGRNKHVIRVERIEDYTKRYPVTLQSEPGADASSITLLVHERACDSGRSAEGRIEIVELKETVDQIRLRVGVRPLQGGGDCQGSPPTPFTIELSEPVGGREIVDSSIMPPRRVPVA